VRKVFFFLLIILFTSALLLTGCGDEQRHTIEEWEEIEKERLSASQEEVLYKGEVLEVISEEKQELEGGLEETLQILKVKITNGPFKGEIIEVNNLSEANSVYNIEVSKGDQIFIIPEFDQEANIVNAYVTDFVRDKYLIIITILFAIILVIVGKFKGLKAVITLAITAVAVVKILLPLILRFQSNLNISSNCSGYYYYNSTNNKRH
jgi:uncharacterized membrane protein